MAYRVPVLSKFSWQEPVLAIANAPAGGESKGARYLVGDTPSGDFVNHAGEIAWFDGTGWQYDFASGSRPEGLRVYNQDDGTYWMWDGAAWTNAQSANGLTLSGDVTQTAAIDWDLVDNEAEALSFDTEGKAGMLVFDTRDGAERLTSSVGIEITGESTFNSGLTVVGDLTVQGTTTTIDSEQLVIEDPIFTLNSGGNDATAVGGGMEIQGDSTSIAAYVKTSADNNGWDMMGLNDNVLEIDILANTKLTMSGNLDVEAASAINQDVTTDADVTFNSVTANGGVSSTGAVNAGTLGVTAGATVGGNLDVTGDITGANLDITSAITANTLDTTSDVTVGGDLAVTGAITGDSLSVTNAVSAASAVISGTVSDGVGSSVSVANMQKAYDSRAYWDADLECVVFDEASLDAYAGSF